MPCSATKPVTLMNWASMRARSCMSWSERAGLISGGGQRTQGVRKVTSRAPISEQMRDTQLYSSPVVLVKPFSDCCC